MNEDYLAAWRAQMDQSKSAMTDLASVFRHYFLALVSAGFSEEQALTMVFGYQSELCRATMGQGGE